MVADKTSVAMQGWVLVLVMRISGLVSDQMHSKHHKNSVGESGLEHLSQGSIFFFSLNLSTSVLLHILTGNTSEMETNLLTPEI